MRVHRREQKRISKEEEAEFERDYQRMMKVDPTTEFVEYSPHRVQSYMCGCACVHACLCVCMRVRRGAASRMLPGASCMAHVFGT